jgi:hypothetical protein
MKIALVYTALLADVERPATFGCVAVAYPWRITLTPRIRGCALADAQQGLRRNDVLQRESSCLKEHAILRLGALQCTLIHQHGYGGGRRA